MKIRSFDCFDNFQFFLFSLLFNSFLASPHYSPHDFQCVLWSILSSSLHLLSNNVSFQLIFFNFLQFCSICFILLYHHSLSRSFLAIFICFEKTKIWNFFFVFLFFIENVSNENDNLRLGFDEFVFTKKFILSIFLFSWKTKHGMTVKKISVLWRNNSIIKTKNYNKINYTLKCV